MSPKNNLEPDWKFDDMLSELTSLEIKPFTMRISVDENDDDTESESTFENQCSYLMDEEGIVGTTLHELSHENHLQVKVCSYRC